MKGRTDSHFSYGTPKPHARMRLFCLPYAGGSARAFRPWASRLPEDGELCPIEIPGRGSRMREKPLTRLMSLVQIIGEEMKPFLDKPFALFGHSMGALISFELARKLRREHGRQPTHLFVSASSAPHLPSRSPITYNLCDAEFLTQIRRLNGTPDDALENPELMQVMLPILRADFELVQTFRYEQGPPLDVPISTFGGSSDPEVGEERLAAWQDQTVSAFSLSMFPGDHFYLHTAQDLLIEKVSRTLD